MSIEYFSNISEIVNACKQALPYSFTSNFLKPKLHKNDSLSTSQRIGLIKITYREGLKSTHQARQSVHLQKILWVSHSLHLPQDLLQFHPKRNPHLHLLLHSHQPLHYLTR